MGWYDVFKDTLSIAQKADNVDLLKKLLELQRDMQDMQQENYEMKKQLQELRDNNDLVNEMEASEDKRSFYRNCNGNRLGPYCPVCWQRDRRLVFLHQGGYNYIDLVCPICKYQIDLGGKNKESEDASKLFEKLNSPYQRGF